MVEAFQRTANQYADLLKTQSNKVQENVTNLSRDGQQKFESVKGDLMNLQQSVQPKLDAQKDLVIQSVQDMTFLTEDEYQHLTESYLWLSVCLFTMGVFTVQGRMFSFLYGMFFHGKFLTVILTSMMIPTWFYLFQMKTPMEKNDRKIMNLVFSAGLGQLIGFLSSGVSLLFTIPPLFVPSLAIAVSAGTIKPANRNVFLASSAGIAMGAYMFLGLLVGFGGSYMLWMLLIVGLAIFDLQTKIGRRRAGFAWASEQVLTLALYTKVYMVIYYLFGFKPEDQ